MNKQIEEMAKAIARICLETHDTDCYERKCEDCRAIYLHNHGYRRAADVAMEIFAEIEKNIFKYRSPYGESNRNIVVLTEKKFYELKKKYESEVSK